jgi:hypothetical protein
MTFEIDWSQIDPKYNWIAIDMNGSVNAYVNEPQFFACYEEWVYKDSDLPNYHEYLDKVADFGGPNDLYERPKGRGHKHARLMVQYAQDALVNEEPWKLWEHSSDGVHWESNKYTSPMWDVEYFYRRKPNLVSIEIPAQHKEAVEAYIKSLEK